MSVHVTPHESGWQVKTGGSEKAYRVTATQKEALELAKTLAKNQKIDVKIHGKDGKVRDCINYK